MSHASMCVAFRKQLCKTQLLSDLTKSCKVKMRGVTLVKRHFRRNYKSYGHKNYTHVSRDPGLNADTFKFIRGAFVIKCQTSKVGVQGLF